MRLSFTRFEPVAGLRFEPGLALRAFTRYTYRVCKRREATFERPLRAAGPAQRGAEVRPAPPERVRGADRRGLAPQHRPGLHDPSASRARRARRERRGRRALTQALPDHPGRLGGADRLAAHAARPGPAAARRARDQGARRPADPRHRRPRDPPGAPPPRDRGHAAVHAGEGGRLGGRRAARARGRRGALPAGSDRPLARRRGRALEAAAPFDAGLAGRRLARIHPHDGGLAMTCALELRQVSKVYGSGPAEVRALDEVALSVERGELVAIMGPSGSGKSTLLTIAGRLEEPTSGQVVVDGVDLAAISRSEQAKLRRRSIGYVFQDFNLLPGLTAIENVTLPIELDGTSARAARSAGVAALEELDVAERADRYPDELSGGERQRVAIARAIVGERTLLLADEPTGALDSVNGDGVMRLLRTATRRGVAGVVVTHEAQLASWADRVVFLRDGRVVDQTAAPPGPESLLAAGDRR